MYAAPFAGYLSVVVAGNDFQPRVAEAIRRARKRYGTMRSFTTAVRDALGWPSLSPAAVYAWESGTTRVPAVALLAAAELSRMSLDQLLDRDPAPETLTTELDGAVRRLEQRVEALERRQSRRP